MLIDVRNTNRYRLSMKQASTPVSRDAPPTGREPAPARRVTSDALLGDSPALVIVHNGREYLLRVTQNGKLILTA
jgi:hemin uptake protein HemP